MHLQFWKKQKQNKDNEKFILCSIISLLTAPIPIWHRCRQLCQGLSTRSSLRKGPNLQRWRSQVDGDNICEDLEDTLGDLCRLRWSSFWQLHYVMSIVWEKAAQLLAGFSFFLLKLQVITARIEITAWQLCTRRSNSAKLPHEKHHPLDTEHWLMSRWCQTTNVR